MTTVLAAELATYAAHRDDLLRAAEGKYVLIHGDKVVGIYDEKIDAVRDGRHRFGMVPILVK